MRVLVLLLVAFVPSLALAQSPRSPYEASAALDGADALVGQIGTLGFNEGTTLTYRFFGPPPTAQSHSLLAAFSPFRALTLGAGVDLVRMNSRNGWFAPTAALGIRLHPDISFSVALRGWNGWGDLRNRGFVTFDVGAAYRPTQWLSLAASIDSATQPGRRVILHFPRFYSLGVAIRPFRSELLTLGVDVRMRDDVPFDDWPEPRATVEVRPASWFGLQLAARTNGDFFFGLSLRERHIEAGGGIGVGGEGVNGTFATLRYRSRATTGINLAGPTTVQLGLTGDLRDPAGLAWWLRLGERPPFASIPLQLYSLASRKDVSSVRVVMQNPKVGLATLHDIRDALAYLKERGKRIIVEVGDADDGDLFLASVADEIVAQPQGTISLNGMKVTLRFWKGLLDKLGAVVDAFPSGIFKNSPDAYTRQEPSDEHRLAQQAIVDGFQASLVGALQERKGMTEEKIQTAMNRALFSASDAMKMGLVDSLSWPNDPSAPVPGWKYDRPTNASETRLSERAWNDGPQIGLVSINGIIMGGDSFEDPFGLVSLAGASTIIKALHNAYVDDNLVAVVLRIDSPGGDILASDLIWQQVRILQTRKPVIVSMGDTCASGGYYIAAPADMIFAQPETVTGSIGVFSYRVDLTGMFDKLGISHTTLTAAPHAAMFDMTHSLTDDEKLIFKNYVGELYGDFVDKVAAGRKMKREQVHEVAQGRVWTGKAAYERGLVDRMGGLVDALNEAKRRAGYAQRELSVRVVSGEEAIGSSDGSVGQLVASGVAVASGEAGSATQALSRGADAVRHLVTAFEGKAMFLHPYTWSVE